MFTGLCQKIAQLKGHKLCETAITKKQGVYVSFSGDANHFITYHKASG